MKAFGFIQLFFIAFLCPLFCGETVSLESLKAGFEKPPVEARPQVWWHWMNGNITKDGIYKDIMWMKKSGIAGFHHFDAAINIAQIVEKRLVYMDEGWKDAFRYAISLADSLDMPVTIASSPGWSSTGGPWVKAENAMKKLVWRTVRVDGGRHITINLPETYSYAGFFQNNIRKNSQYDGWSEDVAVVAIRMSDRDRTMQELEASLTSNVADNLDVLTDDDLATSVSGVKYLVCRFKKPESIRSLVLGCKMERGEWRNDPADVVAVLEASCDGKSYERITDVASTGTGCQILTFPETTAQYFRVSFTSPTEVSELALCCEAKVNHAFDKAGFTHYFDIHRYRTVDNPGVEPAIDLTRYVKDGVLDWDAPEGRWKIFRFGMSLTGKRNHPAPAEATGLEVDKLDPEAWTDYFRHYFQMYKEASGGLIGKRGIQYILTDSYEAGAQTWTPHMPEAFFEQRGYALLPWLPALTGEIIGDSEQTERFLHDWRMTIGKLYADNYARIDDVASEFGILGRYTESHENGREFIGDGMELKRFATFPMSATWVPYKIVTGSQGKMAISDVRESASVSHIYGQNIVSCESLTSSGLNQRAYTFCPENLKPVIDEEFAGGVNRVIIHESAHQPSDEKIPGLGLRFYGQWFNRHETWAPLARYWVDYIARSSYLLQQGRFRSDILYYYGEDSNVCAEYGQGLPEVPVGYNYDFLSPGTLMDMDVANGKIVSPSGSKYEVIVLDKNTEAMSVEVLKKIASLVGKGARIVGKSPERPSSNKGTKKEFDSLVDKIWNRKRSNVYSSLEEALEGCPPDYISKDSLNVVHRDLGEVQVYWVANPTDNDLFAKISFNVCGLTPKLWHPDSGNIEDVTYEMAQGRTEVSFEMTGHDAVFVVFSGKVSENSYYVPIRRVCSAIPLDGPWKLSFQQGRGAPEGEVVFEKLHSFSVDENPGIKYFSGTSTYETTFTFGGDTAGGRRFFLDLGSVKNLAKVFINGEEVAVLWKKPFCCDVTRVLRKGVNSLKIEVTNLWVNRIIGDLQPGSVKYTFTPYVFYQAGDSLLLSGLLGPVELRAVNNW